MQPAPTHSRDVGLGIEVLYADMNVDFQEEGASCFLVLGKNAEKPGEIRFRQRRVVGIMQARA